MSWKLVTTRADHACCLCGQPITAGTKCLSESKPDEFGGWTTQHMCPAMTCHYPPADRALALALPKAKQLMLL